MPLRSFARYSQQRYIVAQVEEEPPELYETEPERTAYTGQAQREFQDRLDTANRTTSVFDKVISTITDYTPAAISRDAVADSIAHQIANQMPQGSSVTTTVRFDADGHVTSIDASLYPPKADGLVADPLTVTKTIITASYQCFADTPTVPEKFDVKVDGKIFSVHVDAPPRQESQNSTQLDDDSEDDDDDDDQVNKPGGMELADGDEDFGGGDDDDDLFWDDDDD